MIPLLAAVTAASGVLTGVLLRYARTRGMLDLPTDRSSHVVPTPRGGGAAVAAAGLAGLAVAWYAGRLPVALAQALLGGGILVAAIGWLDDRRGVSAGVRLMVHAAAAGYAVVLLGGLPGMGGVAGAALAWLGIVWAINLYNFMDGLDGLAASEAVTVATGAAALLWSLGHPGLAAAAALVGAAALGFIPWNWPPARIFLGDVGSGFLGYAFGVLALAAHNSGALSVPFWLAMLGLFVFDATITLMRRLVAGDRVTAPHRLHAYQRLVQVGWSHRRVTGTVMAVNLLLVGGAWIARNRDPAGARLGFAALTLLTLLYLAVERVAPFRRFRNLEGRHRYK